LKIGQRISPELLSYDAV